jgi:hypothetical protein
VKRMIQQWHDMATNVLHAPDGFRKPVAATAAPNGNQHREYSDHTRPYNVNAPRPRKK